MEDELLTSHVSMVAWFSDPYNTSCDMCRAARHGLTLNGNCTLINFYYHPLNKNTASFFIHSIKIKINNVKNIMAVRVWILRSTLGQCGFMSIHNISIISQCQLIQDMKERKGE